MRGSILNRESQAEIRMTRVNEVNARQRTLQRNNYGGKLDDVEIYYIEHLSKIFYNLSGEKVIKYQSRNKVALDRL